MARDLLCIPMAGVGVERLFNYARDMCGYRRGQLQPTTIRALLLVYFAQVHESRLDELYELLGSTVDIDNMTEEEMEAEIQDREKETNIRMLQVDTWDEDQYISDEDVQSSQPERTHRAQLRVSFFQRQKQRPANSFQELSTGDQAQRAAEIEQRVRQDRESQRNPRCWSISPDPILSSPVQSREERSPVRLRIIRRAEARKKEAMRREREKEVEEAEGEEEEEDDISLPALLPNSRPILTIGPGISGKRRSSGLDFIDQELRKRQQL